MQLLFAVFCQGLVISALILPWWLQKGDEKTRYKVISNLTQTPNWKFSHISRLTNWLCYEHAGLMVTSLTLEQTYMTAPVPVKTTLMDIGKWKLYESSKNCDINRTKSKAQPNHVNVPRDISELLLTTSTKNSCYGSNFWILEQVP